MIRSALAAALVAAALTAGVAPQAEARVVVVAPPAVRVEPVPAARPGWVWSPGYWRWAGRRHVWVAGNWVRARPGYVYRAPVWVQGPGGWVFTPGRWAR
jgi:hypothetical protein